MGNKDVIKSVGMVAAGAVAPYVKKQTIDIVHTVVDKKLEDREKLVAVPELYSKEYPLKVEQAVEILNNCGLKVILIEVPIKDINTKYRNCFDTQVIKTQPRAKQKVERGSSVMVKYVTQEVIDESQKLFEQIEEKKSQRALEKSEKRYERKEKAAQVIADAKNIAKSGIEKVPSMFNKDKSEEE